MSWQLRDLTGQIFGRLTVLRLAGFTQLKPKDGKLRSGSAIWTCLCDPDIGGCGNEKDVRGGSLTARIKNTQSCGCLAREKAAERLLGFVGQDSIGFGHRSSTNVKDLQGCRFGNWLVIARAENRKSGTREKISWLVECQGCLARTRRVLDSSSLVQGNSQSCGCVARRRDERGRLLAAA